MQIDEFDFEDALVKDQENDLIAHRETNFVKFFDTSMIDLRYDGHGDPHKIYEIEFYQLQALINSNSDIDVATTVDNLNVKIDDYFDDEKSNWDFEKEEEIQHIKDDYEIKIDSLNERIQELENENKQLTEQINNV